MDLKGRGRKRKNEKEMEKGRVKKEKKRECGNLPFREWLGLPRDMLFLGKYVFGKIPKFGERSEKWCIYGIYVFPKT